MASETDGMRVAGLVLAGGQSRRMDGRDKAFLRLGGQTLVEHAAGRLGAQVANLAISSNAPADAFGTLGLPILPDQIRGFAGPLAGVHAGLCWARAAGFDAIVTAAVDTPFFPPDLAAKLAGDGAAMAASGGRSHPVFAFWPTAAEGSLSVFLTAGHARVMDFLLQIGCRTVEWPAATPDPFFNINTPADLGRAEAWA